MLLMLNSARTLSDPGFMDGHRHVPGFVIYHRFLGVYVDESVGCRVKKENVSDKGGFVSVLFF